MATTPDLEQAIEVHDFVKRYPKSNFNAVEKVIFAAMRGIVAGAIIFPLAYWILGSQYNVRTDHIPTIVVMLILTSFVGASVGLTIGTLIKPEQIGLMFSLILTPLLFTGCIYYPWSALGNIKWFQILTLFNPLTYAAEGMRFAMVPPVHLFGRTVTIATLDMRWVLLVLSGTIIVFFVLGTRTFHHRVVS